MLLWEPFYTDTSTDEFSGILLTLWTSLAAAVGNDKCASMDCADKSSCYITNSNRLCCYCHLWNKLELSTACLIYPVLGDVVRNCLCYGQCLVPTSTWFPDPTQVHIPNIILIGSAILAQLMVVSNRQICRSQNIDNNWPHSHVSSCYMA